MLKTDGYLYRVQRDPDDDPDFDPDRDNDDNEAPETPLDEPPPTPIQDPPAEPKAPYVVRAVASRPPDGLNGRHHMRVDL